MDFKGSVNRATLSEEKEDPITFFPDKAGVSISHDALAEQRAYWKQKLEDAPLALELPIDHPRPPAQTSKSARQSFELPQMLSAALKTLSRQEEIPLFVTLLAAFKTLLHRYTGQDDLLVGTPGAGCTQTELADLSGFFANILVLRTNLSGNPTFRELLGHVRQVTLEAFAHQDVPFEQMVKALRPEQDLSRNPLFQVMFVLEEPSMEGSELPELRQHSLGLNLGIAKVDLTFFMEDTVQELRGWVEYNADLFDASTIIRLVGHWQTLLEGIVANNEQRLSELPLLTGAEQQQLLVEWNATQAAFPKDKCIHQLFEGQVERTPHAIAVVFERDQLTYWELNQRANQLAHYLQRLGVGPEVPTGICMERSLEMVVGLLGILKAGGAYVPLDPAYPRERLAFMLEDTQTHVLVTRERLREGLPEHRAHVVSLDTDWEAIAQESIENPSIEATADNLVYVIYTSGSTGKPKGVMVTHQNLVHSTWARIAYYHAPVTGFLLLSSFAFDSSVAGIFWTLCQGGMLVLPNPGLEQDPSQIAEVIVSNQVSHMLSVPSLHSLLLAQAKPQQLVSLQTVIVAGEACPRELPERHYALLPHTPLFNEYGPTEGTVWSSVYEVPFQGLNATVSIGRPIANTQIYLLDRHLQPVPIGVPGELYIGGAGLARGYLNRPDQTAEKFIPHPYSSEPGARLYKTGDLARYLPTGDIEFLGRLDHQVKLRGFRIELGEIESALGKHPAVQEVVVVAREDVPGDKRLVAYVVPQRGQTPASSELRRIAQEGLPDYMVPSAFVLMETLPLTPNGKVDRRALPVPDRTRPEMDVAFVVPTLEIHHQLGQIWEELLDARPIGIRDNFFELGGHSLLAVRLVDRIEQMWGKKILPATLLADPTIEHLANVLLQTEVADSETGANHSQPSFSMSGQLTSSLKNIWARLKPASSRFADRDTLSDSIKGRKQRN